MAWWSRLPPETIQALRRARPGLSLAQIAIDALRDPAYADDFAQLDVQIVREAALPPGAWLVDKPLRSKLGFEVSEDAREGALILQRDVAAFGVLVVAAVLGEQDGASEGQDAGDGKPGAKALGIPPRELWWIWD